MTFVPTPVAPPAPLPWDVAAITAAALDLLRLDETDDDAERVGREALVATALCELELDYASAPWSSSSEMPAPVTEAAVWSTVELYRRKDAPFGVTDAWSVDGAVVRLSADVMRGVRRLLAPYRSRRGLA